MCGICGIYHYRDGAAGRRAARARDDGLDHATAAPTTTGTTSTAPLGIGMRRLSIIDLDGGAQPISNEDGRVRRSSTARSTTSANCGASSRRAATSSARAPTPRSIVHAYEEWGFEALARLNGMFGLALWDAARPQPRRSPAIPSASSRSTTATTTATLLFGSEIRASSCDPDVPREVDRRGARPVSRRSPSSRRRAPPSRTSSKLPPGHRARVHARGRVCYGASTGRPRGAPGRRRGARVERLRELSMPAVERQMVADVPVGALLSGGVDSTATATIMTEVGRPAHRDLHGGLRRATTTCDETAVRARDVEAARARTHHEVIVSADDVRGLPAALRLASGGAGRHRLHAGLLPGVPAGATSPSRSCSPARAPTSRSPAIARHLGERYGRLSTAPARRLSAASSSHLAVRRAAAQRAAQAGGTLPRQRRPGRAHGRRSGRSSTTD